MCELLNSLKFSDWVDCAQMLIAAGSAYLLYRTFKKQGENDKRSIELAELEKNAKRAEYFPDIKVIAQKNIIYVDNTDYYQVKLKILTSTKSFIVKNSPVLEADGRMNFKNEEFKGKIFNISSPFECYFLIERSPVDKRARENIKNVEFLNNSITNILIEYSSKASFEIFDLLNNKYYFEVIINGNAAVSYTPLTVID